MLVLGVFVLGFVALNASRLSLRVKPSWERYLAGPAGLIAGVMGGITNAHGTPLVVYFYALGSTRASSCARSRSPSSSTRRRSSSR